MENLTIPKDKFLVDIINEISEDFIPNPDKNPHMVVFFIFSKLYKKYGADKKIKTILKSHTQYAMFPLFEEEIRGDTYGWLCLSRRGEKSAILEYFCARQPYENEDFVHSADLYIWAGYWKGSILTDDSANGLPRVTVHTMNKDFYFPNGLNGLKSVSKLEQETIELSELFTTKKTAT